MKKKNSDELQISEISLEEARPKKKKRKKANTAKTAKAVSEEVTDRKERNKELVKVSYFFVCVFLSLVGYLIYFNLYQAEAINSNSYNAKQDSKESQVVRGSILSSDGQILAGTNVEVDGSEKRLYPFEHIFAHVVGYSTNGKAGVEATANFELMSSHASILKQVKEEDPDAKVRGDSIVLTQDSRLQKVCYDALGAYDGAIVVLEPKTGKILAMVSKPDFNPNTISEDWEILVNDTENSSLFNRAVQGQYPPGSTFKILTTLAYLRLHPGDYMDYRYDCPGSISKDGVTINCYNGAVHGYEDLEASFVHSCNGSFASIGMDLNNQEFKNLCESFLFNTDLPIDMPSSKSLFLLPSDASYGEEMMTAIGQGDTVASPLEMALIAATVANGGNMMKPYYLDRIETYDHELVKQYKPSVYKELMTTKEAEILTGFMEKTVTEGTASGLSGLNYTVAGKTGSAEYEAKGDTKETHSWFVGFSNVSDPDIVVAVIAENGGSGSSTAVPIAKIIFDAYHNGY